MCWPTSSITGRVASTGNWDTYHRAQIGDVELQPGKQQAASGVHGLEVASAVDAADGFVECGEGRPVEGIPVPTVNTRRAVRPFGGEVDEEIPKWAFQSGPVEPLRRE